MVPGSVPGTATVPAAEAQPATAKTNMPNAVQLRHTFKPAYPRLAVLVTYPEIRAHRVGGFAPAGSGTFLAAVHIAMFKGPGRPMTANDCQAECFLRNPFLSKPIFVILSVAKKLGRGSLQLGKFALR